MRSSSLIVGCAAVLILYLVTVPRADRHANATPATAAVPAPGLGCARVMVVPAGATISVHGVTGLATSPLRAGQGWVGSVARSVTVEGEPVIPAGSIVRGVVVLARSDSGRSGDRLDLAVRRVTIDRGSFPLEAAIDHRQESRSRAGLRTRFIGNDVPFGSDTLVSFFVIRPAALR